MKRLVKRTMATLVIVPLGALCLGGILVSAALKGSGEFLQQLVAWLDKTSTVVHEWAERK